DLSATEMSTLSLHDALPISDAKYSVIERKALDKILAEQNFSNSDRADSSTAAKIGRILGVDAIIIGSITQFGRDDKNTTVGGGRSEEHTSELQSRGQLVCRL